MRERDGIAYLSFTRRGAELAERLRVAFGGEASCTRDAPGRSLDSWTAEQFPVKRALVYVGAVGIAVRAVAPYLRSKTTDPAVVVTDEYGRFIVPLVSGHLGGANELARKIAAFTGGTAVITTATDLNGVFAVDEWAKRQDCAVIHPEQIKVISGKRLAGETVRVYSAFPVAGDPPDGVELVNSDGLTPPDGVEAVNSDGLTLSDGVESVNLDGLTPPDADRDRSAVRGAAPDIWLDIRRHAPLSLAPRALVLGVGCRKGTARETLERRFDTLCEERGLWPEAFYAAASIDLKACEPGLLSFCAARGWTLQTYRADELRNVPGAFRASAFVERRTGVDNVCERAAVLCSQGTLLVRKYAGEGVTLAVAQRPVSLNWSW